MIVKSHYYRETTSRCFTLSSSGREAILVMGVWSIVLDYCHESCALQVLLYVHPSCQYVVSYRSVNGPLTLVHTS